MYGCFDCGGIECLSECDYCRRLCCFHHRHWFSHVPESFGGRFGLCVGESAGERCLRLFRLCGRFFELLRSGVKVDRAARSCGIRDGVLEYLRGRYPEFEEYVLFCEGEFLAGVEGRLGGNALGGDLSAVKFVLKNRTSEYHDVSRVALSGSVPYLGRQRVCVDVPYEELPCVGGLLSVDGSDDRDGSEGSDGSDGSEGLDGSDGLDGSGCTDGSAGVGVIGG